MDWKSIRKNYPIFNEYIYLDTASAAPLSIETSKIAKNFYDEISAKGDIPWKNWLNRVEDVRCKVAGLINASPEEICFTQSASHGMNIIADILKGEVLTMDEEFPTSTLPFLNKGFKVRFIKSENHVYSINDIANSISNNIRIIVSSHVQASTGFKQNLKNLGELCRNKKLAFVVDASQSIGAFSVDVKNSNIDFMVFSSYKWLAGSYSIGILYINKIWLKNFTSPMAGWFSVKKPDLMNNKNLNLKKTASALEVGSPQFPNIFALGKSIDNINSIGVKNIENRILQLGEYLFERIKKNGLEIMLPFMHDFQSGIFIIKFSNYNKAIENLYKKKIIVSSKRTGIRVSLHFYNNKKDIDHLTQGLCYLERDSK